MSEEPPINSEIIEKLDKKAVWDEIIFIISYEQIEPNEIISDEIKRTKVLTELKNKFSTITEKQMLSIVEFYNKPKKKKTEPLQKESKDLIIPSEPLSEVIHTNNLIPLPLVQETISVYETKHTNQINYSQINPHLTDFQNKSASIEKSQDGSQALISFVDPSYWDYVLKLAETLITPRHLVYIEHKTKRKPDEKATTPYLTARFAKDLTTSIRNISFKVDTKFVPVPKMDDVLVICSCSIYDSNRNCLVEGIEASEYMVKKRPIDIDEVDTQYGDESAIETCNTRCIRRAIEYIIPPMIMDKIVEIAERKTAEAKSIVKKQ